RRLARSACRSAVRNAVHDRAAAPRHRLLAAASGTAHRLAALRAPDPGAHVRQPGLPPRPVERRQSRDGSDRTRDDAVSMATLVEIRILPPLAIARLGSSPDPMDNFDLAIDDPLGARHIRPAETLVVDAASAEIQRKPPPFVVQFRDADGRIRPVAPFFEVWTRLKGAASLVPLTTDLLAQAGLTTEAIGWSVVVANTKAFRRTADPKDRVEA